MTAEAVDLANQEFYSKFPFPRPPMTFPQLEDPDFEIVMLNQSIGDFTHRTIPVDARIWVAGCGTNQAVYTALKFPKATVVGSDLSPVSLEMTRRNAAALGINNLALRQENLNHVTYFEEFDYILCTGVIHHNEDPSRPLANIARALRPNGMLELMVYNRFHRMFNVAFHEAVRALARRADHIPTYEEELEIAKAIAATEPIASSPHVAPFRRSHESHLADALIQPLEYGYTVESLNTLANACGLDLMLPCYDQYDRVAGRVWTIDFSTKELNDRMDALPDVGRWQVVNLLLLERSPMLWFYLCRHRESSQCYEKHVNQEYLDRKFVRASTRLRNQVRGSDMTYALAPASVQYPFEQQNTVLRDVVRSASGKLTMRELLVEHGVDTTNHKAVTDIRMRTATSLCPYLRSV